MNPLSESIAEVLNAAIKFREVVDDEGIGSGLDAGQSKFHDSVVRVCDAVKRMKEVEGSLKVNATVKNWMN